MLLSHKMSSNSLTGLKALPGSLSNLFPSSLNHRCQNGEFFHTSNHLHGISRHNIISCNIISLHTCSAFPAYTSENGISLSDCTGSSQSAATLLWVSPSPESLLPQTALPDQKCGPGGLTHHWAVSTPPAPYTLVSSLIFWHFLSSQFSVQILQNVLIWYHSSILKIKTQCKTVSGSLLESYDFNSF